MKFEKGKRYLVTAEHANIIPVGTLADLIVNEVTETGDFARVSLYGTPPCVKLIRDVWVSCSDFAMTSALPEIKPPSMDDAIKLLNDKLQEYGLTVKPKRKRFLFW